MWPDLPKGVIYTRSFKTHFLLPFVSYIIWPTAHVFNTAECWTVCFHSGLFFKPVWHPQVLGWTLNGITSLGKQTADWITTRLADEFGHGFIYVAALYDMWRCKWRQWSYLAVFSEDIVFVHHFMVPQPPNRSASNNGYTSKTSWYSNI